MKKFLIKVSVYIVLLIAGAFTLQYILEKKIKQVNLDGQTWNIFSSKISSDVIISGNSRAADDFSPQILDSVLHINSYNFGMHGQPFPVQLVRFKLFEKYNQKPKLIIHSVDFFTLSQGYRFNMRQFSPYLHEDLLRDGLRKMGATEAELNIPLWFYASGWRLILEVFTRPSTPDFGHKGYVEKDLNWDGAKFDKVLSGDSLAAKREPEVVALFDSYLSYCKENDIQVILVYTPQYIKATEFTKNWDGEMQLYHDFAKKYDIPFLDYTHDAICNDITYFYNATHLNKKGAELFTLKLANDIKKNLPIKKKCVPLH
ncbi:hypothetical protein AGMMS4957_02480 [Bacteroidia bacterium]|nr:hypothetical protein AGMMS4957_02480 [Bacteroidia bacterium]